MTFCQLIGPWSSWEITGNEDARKIRKTGLASSYGAGGSERKK
jgi:hypothetical protein